MVREDKGNKPEDVDAMAYILDRWWKWCHIGGPDFRYCKEETENLG